MARAALFAGMEIDGFVLEERLYRGGMAAIWRVTRPDIDAPIVLKAPILDNSGELSLLVGFEVEQMIMAELSGPHVPRFYANGDFAVQPYIVMELLDGPTLLQRLAAGPISLEEGVRLALAMAEALADLHRQNVLHLDLKPANVMFRETGEAVLIDFGLSRHEGLPDLLEEQFRKPAGTTDTMAPEQLMLIRSDRRSDVFALGVLIYQVLTGVLPFGSPQRMRQVRRRLWRAPRPPRAIRPEIEKALQEIVLRCLEPLPDRRYQSAEEVAFDLRHLDLVELTERADRLAAEPLGTVLGRWLGQRGLMREIRQQARKPAPRPPIVLVAVDMRPGLEEVRQALLEAAVSVLANIPGARLACLDVLVTSLMAADAKVDAEGDNIHVRRIANLRGWAEPLAMPRGKITYHLVEARSTAAGVIEFARANKVDHLVIAAPATSGIGKGRTMSQITAEAPCTVTVVRVAVAKSEVGDDW